MGDISTERSGVDFSPWFLKIMTIISVPPILSACVCVCFTASKMCHAVSHPLCVFLENI